MAPEPQGGSKAIVITKFTVTGAPADFERAFGAHAEFIRAQPGFNQFQLTRSIQQPEVYANVGWWQDVDSYVRVARSPRFANDVRGMADLVRAEPQVCTKVTNGNRIQPPGESPEEVQAYGGERIMVITYYSAHGDPAAFEPAFADHTDLRRSQPGFIFHEAMRSTNNPGVFLNAEWWMGPDAYEAAIEHDQVLADAARLKALADVEVVQARNILNGEPSAPAN
jgi:quinol monooxygenase YgiN